MSESKDEIHVSVDMPDDHTQEKNHMGTKERSKNQSNFGQAFDERALLQAVVSVIRRS